VDASTNHGHADAPHSLVLLRTRRNRSRDRRAAEQRDELAASHVEHRFLPCLP
jgi:hypothetical protein